jgi:phosphate starvation-inducible protein PhoH
MIEKPKGKRVTKFKGAEQEAFAKVEPLVPLNDNQRLYIDALKHHSQVIVLGPSGTGKTYIAAAYAANQYLMKKINKIIVTRPAVSVGKSLGALPGDLGEKFGPWLSPVLSVLEEKLGKGVVETGIKNGNIQMAPLEYMRGSSFKDALILADECFTGDTEVLTNSGFVRLDQLQEDQQVAQFDGEKPAFVKPTRIVRKDYSGYLTTLGKDRFRMTATAGHDAVYRSHKGDLFKHKFSDRPSTSWKIPVAGSKVTSTSVDPVVTLTCALQADGSYLHTKTSAGNFTFYWTITLKRQEKIDRLSWALRETGTNYTQYDKDDRGRVRFYIPHPDTKYFSDLYTKTFNLSVILSEGKQADFLGEVLLWDGSVKNGSKVYCSTNRANIDSIQACAHLCGYSANYGVQYDTRPIFKKETKPYYRLNVSDRINVTLQKFEHYSKLYDGKVYCVTVPSGMVFVRQNGRVFITGNCQNLDVAQFAMLVTRVGENCKLVMNGDIRQSDIKDQSGLSKAIHLAKKYNLDVCIVEFEVEDIVRSDICKQWVEAFYHEKLP